MSLFSSILPGNGGTFDESEGGIEAAYDASINSEEAEISGTYGDSEEDNTDTTTEESP
jgi:hypothetical protein